jgi:hypothetical protein
VVASKEWYFFSLKILWRTDKLSAVYYAFENYETQLIPRKILEPVIYEMGEYWDSFRIIFYTLRLNLF